MCSVSAEEYEHLKPLTVARDINSVDLLTGHYHPTLPTLQIPAAPNLSLQTMQKFDSKITGTLYPTLRWDEIGFSERRETFSLTYGGVTSEFFECISFECLTSSDTGSKLRGNMNTQVFTYTQGGSGVVVKYNLKSSFFDYSNDQYATKSSEGTWYASQITFSGGEIIDITYDTNTYGVVTYHRPIKLNSNIGYELHITYQSNDITTGSAGWSKLANAYIVKSTNTNVKLAEYTYADSAVGSFTDSIGRTWNYSGFSSAMGQADTARNFTLKLPLNTADSLTVSSATKNHSGTTHNRFVTTVVQSGLYYQYNYVAKTGLGYDPEKQFSKVTIIGPLGYQRIVDLKNYPTGGPSQVTADTDSDGNTTRYTYSGLNVKTVEYPEGNREEYKRDAFGNITEKRQKSKPGSGQADIVISATYNINTCLKVDCYRPVTMTDANGKVTNFTFSSQGNLLTRLDPAGSNGQRRLTTNTYEVYNGITRLAKTSVCAGSGCGTKDEQITEYTYWENTKLPKTVKKTDGAGTLNQTSSYTYDDAGRVTIEDGPLAGTSDATYYRYDKVGRKLWEIAALNQKGHRLAQRFTYRDQDDQISKTETGTVTSINSNNLLVTLIKRNTFDTNGLVIKTEVESPTEVFAVNQITYDSAHRVMCSATRMNALQFNSLPSSACVLDTEGEFGPDRIKKHDYDILSRLIKTVSGHQTVDGGVDIEISYTANGQVASRKDGNGNTTNYVYDGFDRLQKTTFPDNTYEFNTYDAKSSLKTWRKRDGKILTHYYDGLGLTTSTAVPNETSIVYTYDGLGRQTKVARGSGYVSYVYDGLGRKKSSNTNGRLLTYTYDIANRRTRLDHSDSYYVTYQYDAVGAVTSIKEKGITDLVTYDYTNLGRLQTITRGNGKVSTFDYDAPGRVKNFDHINMNTMSFIYNPESQITKRTVSNIDFQIDIPSVGTQNYSTNSLNQYTSVGGKGLNYDLGGNLTSYDGWTYGYNMHNRMTSANKSGTSLTLAYDPNGQLESSTLNGSKTTFLYDGSELVAEYNGSGTMLRRYVHGIGEDDPLVWYEGAGTTNKRYLIADERGSIIAETSNTGATLATHKYGPFGEPVDTSTARFRYTGQILIPGTELYHYKARVYHSEIGRFMQTDPIGYKDGMNWYAYVGNDPLNRIDSTGLISEESLGKLSDFAKSKSPQTLLAATTISIGTSIAIQVNSDKQDPSKVMGTIISSNPITGFATSIPGIGEILGKGLDDLLTPTDSDNLTDEDLQNGNYDGRIRVKDMENFQERLQKPKEEPKEPQPEHKPREK